MCVADKKLNDCFIRKTISNNEKEFYSTMRKNFFFLILGRNYFSFLRISFKTKQNYSWSKLRPISQNSFPQQHFFSYSLDFIISNCFEFLSKPKSDCFFETNAVFRFIFCIFANELPSRP